MKRLFWAKFVANPLLITLTLCVCLCGCRTTTGSDHDQIVRASIDLANSYVELSMYDKAVDVYNRAIEQADDYRLYFNKAIVLSEMGFNTEAALLCQQSFEKYPEIIAFKTAEALYYQLAGELDSSNEAYLQVLELNPYDRDSRIKLIDNLIASKSLDSAYQQTLIMWNQGFRDSKSIEYLYLLEPDTYQVLYNETIGTQPQASD